jgi:hypothetical protein
MNTCGSQTSAPSASSLGVVRDMTQRSRGGLVEDQAHLLEVAPYDALNPVRAGLVHEPGDWPWSRYRATAGLARRPRFLTTDWLLAQLGGVEGYHSFVGDGCPAATVDALLLAA